MKIAVTGGFGFIGAPLAARLKKDGYDVVIVDLATLDHQNAAEVRIADIKDLYQTGQALQGVDAVYHLAGLVLGPVRKSAYNAMAINVHGTLNVLEACRINGVKKILFASSFYVYDGTKEDDTVTEDTPLDVLKMELFGATKLMGEAFVKEYSKKQKIEYVILRFGSTYGPGRCTNVVIDFVQSALAGKPMEVWGEGNRKNQYTYLHDLVDGCARSLKLTNETINLISPERTSIKQLAELMQEKYQFRVTFDRTRPEAPSMAYISSSKAIDKLGWKPTSLREGVEKTVTQAVKVA